MAVDFWHRVVVTGPRGSVDCLRRRLGRTASRSVAGTKWRERIPFSFKRLYELAPEATKIEPDVPCESYDMSVWPIQQLSRGHAEVRYQLHTRNIELVPFVRVLSGHFGSLKFYLVTHCFDDGEIASYQVCAGRVWKWIVPEARHEVHWGRARRKFRLAENDVYDDDEARHFAEEAILGEALDHWRRSQGRRPLKGAIRNWWNRPVSRDLETERVLVLAEVEAQLRAREGADDTRRPTGTGRKRSASARGITRGKIHARR